MIEASLEINGGIERIVEAFLDLPTPLLPVHYSNNETVGKEAGVVSNKKQFTDFLAKSESGFILLGPGITYSVRVAPGKPVICDCFLDVSPHAAQEFLECMSVVEPAFGFACLPIEREMRNRVTVKQDLNTIESWVGRDTQKYVPGFYWLTLLSDVLMKRHHIPLSAVKSVAQMHVEVKTGLHLFRFCDRPEDWQKSSPLANLYVTLPGLFNIENVKSQLLGITSFLELNSLLRQWK
jgi:hypothetical protein